jgi:plasmid maintenance system antidote protein VapI
MYRNLEAECARQGIKKKDIAEYLNVRYATIYDKLKGKFPFTYDEALAIKKKFFPDLLIEYLFDKDVQEAKKEVS